MSYNIVNADGTPLATVADGQVNTTTVSLTLIGKNYAGYGTFLNENFLYLLQNFSSPTAPQNPVGGQLWWKSDTRLLNVYDKITQSWKSISGAQSLSTAPLNPVAGDLWFDTINQQLKTYSGAAWIVIGPAFSASTGTSGAVADTIVDTSLISHVVVKFYVQNSLVAILNKDNTFTPGTTLSGFPVVKPGFNLAQNFASSLAFYDNANNAAYLGGNPASNYVTTTTPSFSGQLSIQNLNGIQITDPGNNEYFALGASNNNINFISTATAYGMVFQTKPANNNGALINAIVVNKVTGLVSVYSDPSPTDVGTTIATKNYVDSANIYVQGQLTSLSTSLNSGITTLSANTTVVYGNVRQTQADLGYNIQSYVPSSSGISVQNGFTHAQAYALFTSSNQNQATTFAGNLLTLWANVAAFYSNILNTSGTQAGQAGSSMYANVTDLQSRISTLSSQAILRQGGQTYSILGPLQPNAPAQIDLGDPGFRFNNFYTAFANVYGYTSGGLLIDSSNPSTGALVVTGGVGVSSNVNVGGSMTVTGNVGVSSNVNVGGSMTVTGNLYIKGTTTTINATSVSTNDLLYIAAANAVSQAAAAGAGLATPYAALTYDNSTNGWLANVNISPTTSNTYSLGSSTGPKWWNNIYSKTGTFQTLTVGGVQPTGLGSFSVSTAAASGGGSLSYNSSNGVYTFTPPNLSGYLTGITSGQVTGALGYTPYNSSNPSGFISQSTADGRYAYAGGSNASGTWPISISGNANTAYYADLAEKYLPDANYVPGTVVIFGGDKEITQSTVANDRRIAGVISTMPAWGMNEKLVGGIFVALTGRVPTKVVGTVEKGDLMVSSGIPGVAMANNDAKMGTVIGKALESYNSNEVGEIEVVVGRL